MRIAEKFSVADSGAETVRKASEEVTAVISILKGVTADQETYRFDPDEIPYTLHLSLLGATILPPYLPRIVGSGRAEKREEILAAIDEVAACYVGCYKDYHLGKEEGRKVLSRVKRIGGDIADYLPEFVRILSAVGKLGIVTNVIIHTDEFAIPWQWVYYRQDPQEERNFLISRFPCGTLIVDGTKDAIENFRDFVHNRELTPTSSEELAERRFCILQGSLGEGDEIRSQSRAYGEHFRNIFTKRFLKKDVVLANEDEWQKHPDEWKLVNRLSELTSNASIVHYSGHIDDNTLLFSEQHKITSRVLGKRLAFLTKRPLVVLHGCSSGKIRDTRRQSEQLATVLLSKGASGCLVALLPVDQPIKFEKSHESMIELFYSNVVGKMMPYGRALHEARNDFIRNPETSHNPQWLFFQLYGDPRGMLIDSPTSTILGKLQLAAEQEDKDQTARSPLRGSIQVFGDSFPLSAKDFQEALHKDGVAEFDIGIPTGTLDVEFLESTIGIIVVAGTWLLNKVGAPMVADKIKILLNSRPDVKLVSPPKVGEPPPTVPEKNVFTVVITQESEWSRDIEVVLKFKCQGSNP